ncbi:uncharacterized protein LOC127771501 [Oryza glaberrima]|uniref:VQ domain-containing protein n=3 Tax=Oryza TaxID=4527 RepID=A0A0D3FZV6_9ORYZ|nr:uncharacterized protein LOC127771501 [Oryza glaberrima]
MRVRTSAAGFRALVQELTSCNADPSKYSPRASADDGCGGGATTLHESGPAAASDADALVAAPGHPAATTFDEGGGVGYYTDDDIFRSQLLDTSYSVFSSPTLLYNDHPHSKV